MTNWFNENPLGNNTNIYAGNGVTGISPSSGIDFFSVNGKIQWERLTSYIDYKRVLHRASPIAAVFYKRADMFANGNLETLNRTTQKYVRGENKDWERLVQHPNPYQSKTAFLKQIHINLDIFGWCYVLPVKAMGFKTPSKLFILPPWCLRIERIPQKLYTLTDDTPIRRVWFSWDGFETEIDEKELILFTDTSSLLCDATLLPEGRLKSLEYPITLQLSAYEALATLLQRKGALGILSNTATDIGGPVSMQAGEKEQIQQEFRKYGLTRDQYQIIISNASLEWQAMGMNVKDLMILETLQEAKDAVCDVYNFPRELMSASSGKGATYENKKEAKKSAYQDCIIMEGDDFVAQLNAGLNTEASNIEYALSYEHVECLQDSEETKAKAKSATWLYLKQKWELGVITRNEMLKTAGDDIVTGADAEEFNKFKFTIDAEIADKLAKDAQQSQGITA